MSTTTLPGTPTPTYSKASGAHPTGKCSNTVHRTLRCAALAISAAALLGGHCAQAANQTWSGGSLTDGNWTDAANWTSGTAPGVISGTTNTDVATFNAAIVNG